MSISKRLFVAAELLKEAAQSVEAANSQRDLAESNYQMQRRNALAFLQERDDLQARLDLISSFISAQLIQIDPRKPLIDTILLLCTLATIKNLISENGYHLH